MRICSPHCGVAPESLSGGETYERDLLTNMHRVGVETELVLAHGKPHPQNVPGWTVHRFPIRRGLRWYVAPWIVPRAIHRVWRTRGFDLLRVHSLRYMGPSALYARWRYGLDVPVVSHHHHLDPHPLNRLIEKRVIEGSDRVIVGSEFAKRQLREHLGVRTDHVAVVPYGVQVIAPGGSCEDLRTRYGVPAGALVVLFLGGLKPRKNLSFLLRVWVQIHTRYPTARLLLAGDGPLRAALESQARRDGVQHSVVFTGPVYGANKIAHLHLADVFAFPSAMEGFGIAVAEAMSAGVPVVASDRGALPEVVVAGETGFCCNVDVEDEFTQRLLMLLGDADMRQRFGDAGRARVLRMFRWEECVEGVRRVYAESFDTYYRRRGTPAHVVYEMRT